jgi:hypothetical protein
MTDPVASRSGFLCTYMSTHPDTLGKSFPDDVTLMHPEIKLVAYVQHFGKVKVPVVSASMTSIDTKVNNNDYHHQLIMTKDPCVAGNVLFIRRKGNGRQKAVDSSVRSTTFWIRRSQAAVVGNEA